MPSRPLADTPLGSRRQVGGWLDARWQAVDTARVPDALPLLLLCNLGAAAGVACLLPGMGWPPEQIIRHQVCQGAE